MNMNMKLLTDLYSIHSASGQEKTMSAYVQTFLKHHGIPFETDRYGQVFNLIPGRPIISCHMDQVQLKPCGKIKSDGKKLWGSQDGLGADDKNGIWVCLNLLLKWDCSFIFSVCEESMEAKVESVLKPNESVLWRIPYALVFDRRGAGDIIGVENGYCTPAFQIRVAREGRAFGYKPTMGVYSDADSLCQFTETVNLSVGYHEAHTAREYTVIEELVNALAFGEHLLNSL